MWAGRGSGDRAFSAGADIAEFAGSVEAGVERALRDFVRRGQRLTRHIEGYTKPLIAAVNGIAFGAGCEISEAAPLALASDRARFAKPEIRLGFPPPFGGTQRLPRLIGRKRALQMILTAEPIDAKQAVDIGLIQSSGRAHGTPVRGPSPGRSDRAPLASRGCCMPAERHPRAERIDRRGAGHRGHAVRLDGADARHPPGHRSFLVSAQVKGFDGMPGTAPTG